MTTDPTPLPPLAEVLREKSDEATPLELAMSAYDTAADLAAPYDAELARLREENAELRDALLNVTTALGPRELGDAEDAARDLLRRIQEATP